MKMAQPRDIFARNLKENRRRCGLSQEKLAERVNVSTHHIAMIELARNFPTSELMERIASVLNVKIQELFAESHSPHEEWKQLRREIRDDMKQLLDEFVKKTNAPVGNARQGKGKKRKKEPKPVV
jgi:transcriptional regulator with XRE-family HTH domain